MANALRTAIIVVVLLTSLFLIDRLGWHQIIPRHSGLQTISSEHPTLNLLIPANQPDVNVCKLLLSSTILRYPTATLLNWGNTYDNENVTSGGAHIGKLYGVLNYLAKIDEAHGNDLVLMVDGHDSWFQLDPSVLLHRYHKIMKRGNERIEAGLGRQTMLRYGIKQTILFSTQKICWPGEGSSLCWAVPPAELPPHVYGPETDNGEDAKNRQRWLNSGFIIGPAKDLRPLFQRALDVWKEDPGYGRDQAAFAQIFGSQEFHRLFLKELQLSEQTVVTPSVREGVLKKIRQTHSDVEIPSPDLDSHFEFGIGIDYESALSQPTVFADTDLAWVEHNSEEQMSMACSRQNVTINCSAPLDEDIMESSATRNPLAPLRTGRIPSAMRSSTADIALPSRSMTWKDVKLFTNLWTGVTPAVIHHNAHRDGLKANRETMWPEIWFQPLARRLLASRMAEDRWSWPSSLPKPLSRVQIRSKKAYSWNPLDVDPHAPQHDLAFQTDLTDKDGDGAWVKWSEICSAEMDEELFRDQRE